MKVAFDTDVIVASLRNRSGASNALLHMLSAGQVEAVASVPMMEDEDHGYHEQLRPALARLA